MSGNILFTNRISTKIINSLTTLAVNKDFFLGGGVEGLNEGGDF